MVSDSGPEEVPAEVEQQHTWTEQVAPEETDPPPPPPPPPEKTRMPAWAWALIGAMAATIVLGGAYLLVSGNRGASTLQTIASSETSAAVEEATGTPSAGDTLTAEAGADIAVSGGTSGSSGSGGSSGSSGSSDQGSGSSPAPPPADPPPSDPPAQPSQPSLPKAQLNNKAAVSPYATIFTHQSNGGTTQWTSDTISPGTGVMRVTVKVLTGNPDADGNIRLYKRTPSKTSLWANLWGDTGTDDGWSKTVDIPVSYGVSYWLKVGSDAYTTWKLTIQFKRTQ